MSRHVRPTPEQWFHDHHSDAAEQIINFLAADGISLDGKKVADVGCGEGTISLGLAHRADIAQLDAYDLRPGSRGRLAELARNAGVSDEIPVCLNFHESSPTSIPAPPDYFDFVFSWSAFEHVRDPVGLLSEVRRILSPGGVFFLQIWPLFHSEHGGHLWLSHADEPFAHLREPHGKIEARISEDEGTYPGFKAIDEWVSLNRTSLDDIQRSLLASRLVPTRVELMTSPVHLTRDLMRYRLSDLTIGGVKLLAVPWGVTPSTASD